MARLSRNLSFLIKPASENCNIDCSYCFYHHRPDDPYAEVATRRRMSKEQAEDFLTRAFNYANGGQLSFAFQGGEPVMAGLDYFEYFCSAIERLGKSGQSVSLSLQTNGILLNDAFCELFKKYNFLIGISLDGPAHLHDAYRRDYLGKGTQHKVLEGIKLLKKHAVDFNVLAVVNEKTQHHAKEIYNYYTEELNVKYMQFNVCVEERAGKLIAPSVTPEGYAHFLSELFDVWFEKGYGKVSVRLFDSFVNKMISAQAGMCFHSKRCAETLVLEYNGDVYPCDFFVRDDYALGNIFTDSLESILSHKNRIGLADEKERLNNDCKACEFKNLCRGGCPKYRHLREFYDARHHFYFCEAYKGLLAKLTVATQDFVKDMRARR